MMEYAYYTDIFSMLQALAAGLIMGIYYDAFRLLRRIVHFESISVAMQDFFFWITSAVYLFFVCVKLNNGYIRIYFVFFALVGWSVYYITLGKIIFAVFDFIIKYLSRILATAKKTLVTKMSQLYTRIK